MSLAWHTNFRPLRVAPVEQRHVAGTLHELCRVACAKFVDDGVAGTTIADTNANFDQLMVCDGCLEFGKKAICQPGFADHDERFKGVAEAAKEFLL